MVAFSCSTVHCRLDTDCLMRGCALIRRLAVVIPFMLLWLPATAQSAELWVSLTKDASVVLNLRDDGSADYQSLTRGSNGRLYYLRSITAKWGTYSYPDGATWMQLAGKGKATRYFWVDVTLPDSAAKFDFAQIGNRVYEVDKTGVTSTLVQIEDGRQK